jgi:hypothetical protein
MKPRKLRQISFSVAAARLVAFVIRRSVGSRPRLSDAAAARLILTSRRPRYQQAASLFAEHHASGRALE